MAVKRLAELAGADNEGGEFVPWERAPGESNHSWQAFQLYRDLGINRSYPEVARRLNCSDQNIRIMGAKHEFTARARAWDAYVDKRYRDEFLAQQRDVARAHLDAARYLRKRAMGALEKMSDRMLRKSPAACIALLKEAVRIEAAHYRTEQPPPVAMDAGPATDTDASAAYFDGMPLDKMIEATEKALTQLYQERQKQRALADDADTAECLESAADPPVE